MHQSQIRPLALVTGASRGIGYELAEQLAQHGYDLLIAADSREWAFPATFARKTELKNDLNLISLNVVSPVHIEKRVLEDMTARGQGEVLFTSSIAATMQSPFESTYGASKAFLKSSAETIRNELKDTGVTVTTLMPGATETNSSEALMTGKDHVVAGSFKNKVQATASHLLPDTITAQLHRNQ